MTIDQLSNPKLLTKQGRVKVFENSLFRWLCFDDEKIIQSCMLKDAPAKLNLPYQPFMMMWQLLFNQQPSTACLLGLGGGDMVRYLSNKFPLLKLQVVEHNSDIAKVASEYFLIQPEQNQLTVEIADAEEFIKNGQQYDLLFVDIVADNKLPDSLFLESFWQNCHNKLNDNGILVVNVVSESENKFLELLVMLRKEFGHLPLCMGVPDHKNIVLLMPVGDIPKLDQLKQRSKKLQRQSELPFQECIEILMKDNVILT